MSDYNLPPGTTSADIERNGNASYECQECGRETDDTDEICGRCRKIIERGEQRHSERRQRYENY